MFALYLIIWMFLMYTEHNPKDMIPDCPNTLPLRFRLESVDNEVKSIG